MTDFYQDLLSGSIELKDLTDEQVKKLSKSWEEDGRLHPTAGVWDASRKELRRREIVRASKPKPKKFNREFF